MTPRPATSSTARPPSGSKLTRSARSRTGPLGTRRTSVRIILSFLARRTTTYICTVNRQPISVTLPTQVAPGDYLVRNEIIALQLAVSLGGAEFYPSCTQIRVGGSKTGTPNQTVLFPGAYSDNDPGIYDPNVYSPGAAYVFPGPPVSNLASPQDMTGQPDDSSPSGGNSSPTSTGKNGKPTTATGSGPQPTAQTPLNRVCKLQKRGAALSRRGMDIGRHKRLTSFMRAIRDVFYYS